MSTQPLLLTELNTWFERLGPVFHDKAREVFRLRYEQRRYAARSHELHSRHLRQ